MAVMKVADFTFVHCCADGRAHGVLLWNSNAMDVVLTNETASFRVTGGVLDLYFFMGPGPMQVLEQFTRLFGRPAMQPRWALGFHQSKCPPWLSLPTPLYARCRCCTCG